MITCKIQKQLFLCCCVCLLTGKQVGGPITAFFTWLCPLLTLRVWVLQELVRIASWTHPEVIGSEHHGGSGGATTPEASGIPSHLRNTLQCEEPQSLSHSMTSRDSVATHSMLLLWTPLPAPFLPSFPYSLPLFFPFFPLSFLSSIHLCITGYRTQDIYIVELQSYVAVIAAVAAIVDIAVF